MYLFSRSTGQFYARAVNGSNVPQDAVEISDAEHRELLIGEADGWKISSGASGLPTLVPPLDNSPTADELCTGIDTAADAARAAVAGDPLRAVEYDRARIEAQAFVDSGYPADAVPRTVAAWAINGRTAQQAADNILAEAAAYTEALYVIRETRLAAKEQIRKLMGAGEAEQAQQLAEQTIAAIEAAVAGVGNAAA